jgi:hypothetical protein
LINREVVPNRERRNPRVYDVPQIGQYWRLINVSCLILFVLSIDDPSTSLVKFCLCMLDMLSSHFHVVRSCGVSIVFGDLFFCFKFFSSCDINIDEYNDSEKRPQESFL